ncbi:DinB family protein [Pedobacter arcticus]|uniref:DinB family protein n=1 Tax=Pedobacter arcticus TaxID=752140 RepID=UPI0002E942F4|nr:DinB family protein [Pedobacter arcticus]
MSVKSESAKVLESLKFYGEFLKTLNNDIFLTTPQQGGWSFSEVYAHILSANLLSVIAIEKCLNRSAEIKTRKPDWRAGLILFFGRFPPGKFKVPQVLEASVKKISKEEASNELIRLVKKITELEKGFSKFNPNYKVKHPRLGYLDAKSWLRFIYVHSKHHQKQIKRIGEMLSNSIN